MKGKKSNTGKRYTEAEKQRILDFIASQGRGGISAAQKKYGVSYIAIRGWRSKKGEVPQKAGKRMDSNIDALRQLKTFTKALKAFAAKL